MKQTSDHERNAKRRQKAEGKSALRSARPLITYGDDETPTEPKVAKAARDRIRQAESDVSRGLKDTEQRGTPSNVPGPGPDPQRSPGAMLIEADGGALTGAERRRPAGEHRK